MKRFATLLIAGIVVASGCRDSPKGRVTLRLLTHDSFVMPEAVIAQFEKEQNVAVEVVKQGDAGALVNQAVLAKDNPIGDVLYGVDNAFLSRAFGEDVFAPYRSSGAPLDTAALGSLSDPGGGVVTPIDYGDVCINYDTEWFAKRSIRPPRRIGDLLARDYEGLTVVENPASSSPGLAFLLATIDRQGDGWPDYWRSLVENDVLVVEGWEQAWNGEFSAGGGKGTRPIVVSYASSPPADVMFADPPRNDTRIAVLTDGCFRQVEYAGVLNGSEHVEEARALIDFMMSREFQAEVAPNMFVFPARLGITLPRVFVKFAARPDAPVVMTPEAIEAVRDSAIDTWTEIALP